MKLTKFCKVWLTVGGKEEAGKIANVLLDKRLVACVRQLPASSSFRWQGKINHTEEMLLQMESREDLFEQIEAEVTKLHSYDTFVLESTPVSQISKSAENWLPTETRKSQSKNRYKNE